MLMQFFTFFCIQFSYRTRFEFQMAQNGTYLVGCGFAVCENEYYKHYYVCNYAAG